MSDTWLDIDKKRLRYRRNQKTMIHRAVLDGELIYEIVLRLRRA